MEHLEKKINYALATENPDEIKGNVDLLTDLLIIANKITNK